MFNRSTGTHLEPSDQNVSPIRGSIFDLPEAYQSLFGRETAEEFLQFASCLETHLEGTTDRIFEPGCGGGRLLKEFADDGWTVGGLDSSDEAVAFANRVLVEPSDLPPVVAGDMADFDLASLLPCEESSSEPFQQEPFDAAYCSVNTIRHLVSDDQILDHLTSMASIVRPGGVYVIELELTESADWEPDTESFQTADGAARAVIWRKRSRNRQEVLGTLVSFDDGRSATVIEGEVVYRTYSREQAVRVFDVCDRWSVVADEGANESANPPSRDRRLFILRRRDETAVR